ncbi:MAG: class I SAM-dependent methyltransferase [Gammaproteobacteria bacterium]|nr:class I SAM-dependent methyltransferase [Gammaproteobacteria bacterium]
MDQSKRKQQIKTTFSTVASGYDNPAMRYFPFCGDKLIALVSPRPGEKILDVAAGTGAATIAAAQMVAPGGRVTAIDFSEPMLEKLEKNAAKMALFNIDVHVMDAETLEFRSDYFHHVLCSFGLFFMDDMDQALRQWIRVCRPGGSIAFTSFGSEAFEPMMSMFKEKVTQLSPGLLTPDKPCGMELLTDKSVCRQLMENAGLVDCQITTLQMGYHLKSVDDWWDIVWSSGLRGMLMQLSQDEIGRFKIEHFGQVESLQSEQGIYLNVETHFSMGRKPKE